MIIENIGNEVLQYLISISPYRTGNLRYNGISTLQSLDANTVMFTIGGQQAPYGYMLNDEPTIRGNVNIHHLWIDNGIDEVVNKLAIELGGYVI